jgi:peptidoglycan/LPS O-acetylase OafA/YrhL
MRTLREALDFNKGIGPGFHFLRHALSVAIVVWHCRQAIWWTDSALVLAAEGKIATGASRVLEYNLEDILRPAVHSLVGMFFALSGFLVAGSALRTKTTGKFLANRGLRIFPALGAETLLSAFILGPAVTALSVQAYFSDPEFFRYFGNMIGWVYFQLPGVFVDNPLPRIVNGQLWTLQPEFWCYAIMAVMMASGLIKNRKAVVSLWLFALVVSTALYLYDPVRFDPKGENFFLPWYITFLFWFGVVAFLFAEKVPLQFGLFAGAVLWYWASIFYNTLVPLSGIPLTYIMVYIGFTAFPLWDRLVKSDYSYGIYLYHFPIIQTLMWLLNPTAFGKLSNPVQLVLLFPLSLVITIGFAALSWRFIEKPALSLRKVFARTEPVTGELPPASATASGLASPPDTKA